MINRKKSRAALDAMELELARSLKGLQIKGHPKPCYLSYLMRVREGYSVWGRYGTIYYSCPLDSSTLHADLRVGSYRNDQTVDGRIGLQKEDPVWHNRCDGPEELDPFAIRYSFWRLTQARHLEALQDYYDKKSISLEEQLFDEAPSLRKANASRIEAAIKKPTGTLEEAAGFVRRVSALFLSYPKIDNPYVKFREVVQTRLIVNSEGTRSVAQEHFVQVSLYGGMLAPDGVRQNASRAYYVRQFDELPSEASMTEVVESIYRELLELVAAEPMEPYAGPALFGGIAAGVLFHEAIGHRLEGERLLSRNEGRTFAGKVGKRIIPAGIDLFDDPTLTKVNGHTLYGHYQMDDEGTPPERVHLIEDGVLRRFLTSRNGIPGQSGSNGHGRAEREDEVMARMGNLIVKAREPLTTAQLEERWMEEVAARDNDFGLLVTDADSGETSTSSDAYDFQAFQINPTAVYRVDRASGKRKRVRDVSFVGTPLAAIQGVLALGDDPAVDNSYCSAESGSLPVGTVAPSALLRDIEVQRSTSARNQPPSLRLPPRRK
ncbi:MAG: TldD protein [Planctomycetota bacterium]|jgi:TldD protein